MKVTLPIIALLLSCHALSQYRNPFAPIQADSMYVQQHVKARHVNFAGPVLLQSDFSDYFNLNGQIVETISYQPESRVSRYQTRYYYDNTGKLDKIVSRDLTGEYGLLINPYSSRSNYTSNKFDYDSSNKLARITITDSSGKLFSDWIFSYALNSKTYRQYDKTGTLRHNMKYDIETKDLTTIEETFYDSSKSQRLSYSETYEFDDNGRISKFTQTGKGIKTIFKYHYNREGLIKKVVIDNGYNLSSETFKYDFWD